MRPRGHFRMQPDELKKMAGGTWYNKRDSVRGVHGVVFYMGRVLLEGERARVEHYGNTKIMKGSVDGHHRFDAVFIGERCFTEGERMQRELQFT